MSARFLNGLGPNTTLTRRSQIAASLLLAVIAVSTAASYLEARVTDLMLANLVVRATDQVELGLVPKLSPADFDAPHEPNELQRLDSRLDQVLIRARESASDIIRIDLFALDGTVLYSDLASLQGQVVSPLANPHLAAALAGSASAEVSYLTRQEDADLKRRYDMALEAYVPCIIDGHVVGAYELYADPQQFQAMRLVIWVTVGLAVALLVCLSLVLLRFFGRPVSIGAAGTDGRAPPSPLIRTGLIRGHSASEEAATCQTFQRRGAATPNLRNPDTECWLSRRETEVLRLLGSDRTYGEIAAELSLSEETVRSHVKSILHKLGQPDRSRAVAAAIRAGVLEA